MSFAPRSPAAPTPPPQYPDFPAFWRSLTEAQRKPIREACVAQGMHPVHLYLVATGQRKAGSTTIARLQQADPRITPQLVRPDLFKREETK
jgi:hypothetical protein